MATAALSKKSAARDDVAHWAAVCNAHMSGGLLKQSNLGNDAKDSSFDQAFSNMAHAVLRQKAPALLDHEIGFQLLDRDAEKKKAVGVFGFKVGSQHIYAPVFFVNGQLKGQEMLYLKDQDLFVPLKENWIQYLLNRRPHIIGSGVNRQDAMRGITQPDLMRLRHSPYKFASACIDSVAPFMPKLGSLAAPDSLKQDLAELKQLYEEKLNLPNFLKTASVEIRDTFVGWLQQYPRIARAVDQSHGIDKIAAALKEGAAYCRVVGYQTKAAESVSKYRENDDENPKTEAKQKVKVLYFDAAQTSGPSQELTEEDNEKLFKDRFIIKDNRKDDEVAIPYNVQVERKLFNPAESGLYEVLVKPGTFERCYVAVHPHGPNGRANFCTVVRLDDSPNYTNHHAGNIWCTTKIETEEWDKWYEKLPVASEKVKARDRAYYVAIGPRGDGTLPFCTEIEIGDGGGEKAFDAHFDTHHDDRKPYGLSPSTFKTTHWDDRDYCPYKDGERIRFEQVVGTKLRSDRGDLYVPKNARLLKARKVRVYDYDKDNDDPDVDYAEPSAIQPGSILDAQLSIQNHTNEIKIATDRREYRVNGGRPMNKIAALVHLVRDHGFREDTARTLLKQADTDKVIRPRVKYAAPPYLSDQGPTAPSQPEPPYGGYNPMGFSGQTQGPQEMNIPVEGMSARFTDPNAYNPSPMYTPSPYDMGGATASGNESSQREVLDTSMISSLLRTVRDEGMIDRWLPDLTTGLDRILRILFSLHWHTDRFEERYGKGEIPELEDSLINTAECLGDVTLFMKQKSVEAFPEESTRGIDLKPTAGI